MEETIKCLIIGSGPAGFYAAPTSGPYSTRVSSRAGNQDVENFPGYPDGVGGQQMMADMRRQAERFGADIRKP